MRLTLALILVLLYLIIIILGIIGVSIWSLVVFSTSKETACCIPSTCSNIASFLTPKDIPNSAEICHRFSAKLVSDLACTNAYNVLTANLGTCNTTLPHSCFTPHKTSAKTLAIVAGVCGLLAGIGLLFALKRRIMEQVDNAIIATSSSSTMLWVFGLLAFACCVLSLVALNVKGGSDVSSGPAYEDDDGSHDDDRSSSSSAATESGGVVRSRFGAGCGGLSGTQAQRVEATSQNFTPVLAVLATLTGLPTLIFFVVVGVCTNYFSQSENNPFQITFLWWNKRANDDGTEKIEVDENGQNIRSSRSGYVSEGQLVEILLKNSKNQAANGTGSGLLPETELIQTLSPTTQALFFAHQQKLQRQKMKSEYFPEYADSLAESGSVRSPVMSPENVMPPPSAAAVAGNSSSSKNNNTTATIRLKKNRGEDTVMGNGMLTDNEGPPSKDREDSFDSNDSPFRAGGGSKDKKYEYRNESSNMNPHSQVPPHLAAAKTNNNNNNKQQEQDEFYKKKETWRPKVVSMSNPLMTTDDEGGMSGSRRESSLLFANHHTPYPRNIVDKNNNNGVVDDKNTNNIINVPPPPPHPAATSALNTPTSTSLSRTLTPNKMSSFSVTNTTTTTANNNNNNFNSIHQSRSNSDLDDDFAPWKNNKNNNSSSDNNLKTSFLDDDEEENANGNNNTHNTNRRPRGDSLTSQTSNSSAPPKLLSRKGTGIFTGNHHNNKNAVVVGPPSALDQNTSLVTSTNDSLMSSDNGGENNSNNDQIRQIATTAGVDDL